MSINLLPPEVLVELLSHLLDVSTKIRLERVSKLFRACVGERDAWKHNTTLDMSRSEQELRSFLAHAREVNFLSLVGCRVSATRIAAVLWDFEAKLQIEHLHISSSCIPCPDNFCQLVAMCIVRLHKSLKSIRVTCCRSRNCQLLNCLTVLLHQCTNLSQVTLRNFNARLYSPGGADLDDHPIILALRNLNLKTVRLIDFTWMIEEQSLATVFNSAQEHSIHTLHLENTRGDGAYFWFDRFCGRLNPIAAQAITTIHLYDIDDTGWVHVLGTPLLSKLPNLSLMTVLEDLGCEKAKDKEEAFRYSSAVAAFLHSCRKRNNTIYVQVALFACPEFVEFLWSFVSLVGAKGARKRRHDGQGWKRRFRKCCGTIDLDVLSYDC